MGWKCFLMEPTEHCRRWLRVYASADACPLRADGATYCEATTPIADGPAIWVRDEAGHLTHYRTEPIEWPRDDPRWPTACAHCGRVLAQDATHQLAYELLYRAPDGAAYTIRDMPVGAIWRAEHMEAFWGGDDGRCYQVQLPPGGIGNQWIIEQPSQSGGGWTRTGIAPNLTASPSILTPQYHGYLTAGLLTDDLDGRRYGGGAD